MVERRRWRRLAGSAPVSLGEGIRQAIAGLGIEARLLEYRALLLWPEVAEKLLGGPVANLVRPTEIRRGELVVSIPQDALRHRFMFERERLRTELNRAVGREVVRSIRVAK